MILSTFKLNYYSQFEEYIIKATNSISNKLLPSNYPKKLRTLFHGLKMYSASCQNQVSSTIASRGKIFSMLLSSESSNLVNGINSTANCFQEANQLPLPFLLPTAEGEKQQRHRAIHSKSSSNTEATDASILGPSESSPMTKFLSMFFKLLKLPPKACIQRLTTGT